MLQAELENNDGSEALEPEPSRTAVKEPTHPGHGMVGVLLRWPRHSHLTTNLRLSHVFHLDANDQAEEAPIHRPSSIVHHPGSMW